jgi:hypothetical protein
MPNLQGPGDPPREQPVGKKVEIVKRAKLFTHYWDHLDQVVKAAQAAHDADMDQLGEVVLELAEQVATLQAYVNRWNSLAWWQRLRWLFTGRV